MLELSKNFCKHWFEKLFFSHRSAMRHSIIDNYKMFSEIMWVGTLDDIDPITKCHWEKTC